jgi:transposase
LDYHAYLDRSQARLQVIQLYYQGWNKGSISRFFLVSRPTVDAWIRRFEAEHFAGFADNKRGPKTPCKVWLPLMVQVYDLQKARIRTPGSFGSGACWRNRLSRCARSGG